MSDDSKQVGLLVQVVAAVSVVFFGAISVYLIRHVSDPDPQWSRLVYIYAGLEALVFAAAGALFGSRVQRSNALAAEKRAASAEAAASAAAKDATDKRAIAAAVRAERAVAATSTAPATAPAPRPTRRDGLSTETIGSTAPASASSPASLPVLDRLVALIDELDR